MIIINSTSEIRKVLFSLKKDGKSIGFVPTMGALHSGHISLIKKATTLSDITVCSIFVNPTQFNNQEDLDNYPSTIEKDSRLLEESGCDILFLPQTSEIYSSKTILNFNFGKLENVMEGAHRPGHFNGVALIVSKLFNIINPDTAYFGQKDFQQLAIIKQMVKDLSFNIEIESCTTFREESGLAMSSRNTRLSIAEKNEAANIYQSLLLTKKLIGGGASINEIKKEVDSFLSKTDLKIEYYEISNAETLQPILENNSDCSIVVCIAAFLGKVRLIDNIVL